VRHADEVQVHPLNATAVKFRFKLVLVAGGDYDIVESIVSIEDRRDATGCVDPLRGKLACCVVIVPNSARRRFEEIFVESERVRPVHGRRFWDDALAKKARTIVRQIEAPAQHTGDETQEGIRVIDGVQGLEIERARAVGFRSEDNLECVRDGVGEAVSPKRL
jgi:hypothetical protein